MIKGIRNRISGGYYRYDNMLVVPITENTPEEKDLKEWTARAVNQHPDSCGVLVRHQRLRLGETWVQAKTLCECCDCLILLYQWRKWDWLLQSFRLDKMELYKPNGSLYGETKLTLIIETWPFFKNKLKISMTLLLCHYDHPASLLTLDDIWLNSCNFKCQCSGILLLSWKINNIWKLLQFNDKKINNPI